MGITKRAPHQRATDGSAVSPAGAGHVFCVSRLLSLRFDKGIGITRRENGHILISEAYPFSENGRILTDLGLGNRENGHIFTS